MPTGKTALRFPAPPTPENCVGGIGSGPANTYEWYQHIPVILERMSNGETLRGVCRDLKLNPATVRNGVVQDRPEGFRTQYTQARELQVHSWVDEILDESGEAPAMIAHQFGEKVDHGDVALRRLRTDNKKWIASRLLPKVYGDRIDVTSGGEKMQGPIAALPAEVIIPPDKA